MARSSCGAVFFSSLLMALLGPIVAMMKLPPKVMLWFFGDSLGLNGSPLDFSKGLL